MQIDDKSRPILFNSEMVRAVLDGRKTQTRRVIKPQPPVDHDQVFQPDFDAPRPCAFWCPSGKPLTGDVAAPVPYGKPGDLLFPAMPIPSLGRNYCADVHGFIWSRARNGITYRRLKGSPTSRGYLSVTPAVDGAYKTRLVHRLVAEAFYGTPGRLTQVRHLDGNRQNNRPDNLDWGTAQNNWSDRLVHGGGCGDKHHSSRLTSHDVLRIRALHTRGFTTRQIAAQKGVSQSAVWSALREKTWLTDPVADPPNMPRWASRITLRVTDVRVERVQDISPYDCHCEGIASDLPSNGGDAANPKWPTHNADGKPRSEWRTVVAKFRDLWDSINAKRGYGWEVNPWVWVVEFERVTDAD